jgi:hypothetical protein
MPDSRTTIRHIDGVGSIEVHQQAPDEDALEFTVDVHGPGISPDQFDVTLPGQAPPGCLEHANAGIHADDTGVTLREQLRPRPGPAADVEHRSRGIQSREPSVDHRPLERETMLDAARGKTLFMGHVRSRVSLARNVLPVGADHPVVEKPLILWINLHASGP